MKYEFMVMEHRLVRCLYTTEADTLVEAKEKAERGETVAETELAQEDVLNRTIVQQTVPG